MVIVTLLAGLGGFAAVFVLAGLAMEAAERLAPCSDAGGWALGGTILVAGCGVGALSAHVTWAIWPFAGLGLLAIILLVCLHDS